MTPSSAAAQKAAILDQFTRQAVPFAENPVHSEASALQLIASMSGVSPDDEVLDVACGPGIIACHLAPLAKHVTGIDLTPAMIEQAGKLAAEKGLANLTWRLGDVESLPFADGTFSLVTSRYAFHHLLRPAVVLAEMARVRRPGGRIALIDVTPAPGKGDAYDEIEKLRDPSHTHALSVEEFRELGHALGLGEPATAAYSVELELDSLLNASFPPAGNAARIRELFHADIGLDHIGMGANLQGGAIYVGFPTSIFVWR